MNGPSFANLPETADVERQHRTNALPSSSIRVFTLLHGRILELRQAEAVYRRLCLGRPHRRKNGKSHKRPPEAATLQPVRQQQQTGLYRRAFGKFLDGTRSIRYLLSRQRRLCQAPLPDSIDPSIGPDRVDGASCGPCTRSTTEIDRQRSAPTFRLTGTALSALYRCSQSSVVSSISVVVIA